MHRDAVPFSQHFVHGHMEVRRHLPARAENALVAVPGRRGVDAGTIIDERVTQQLVRRAQVTLIEDLLNEAADYGAAVLCRHTMCLLLCKTSGSRCGAPFACYPGVGPERAPGLLQ